MVSALTLKKTWTLSGWLTAVVEFTVKSNFFSQQILVSIECELQQFREDLTCHEDLKINNVLCMPPFFLDTYRGV